MNRAYPKNIKETVFKLRLEGFTMRQIAHITSIPLSTVSWWIAIEQKVNKKLLAMKEKQ